jgi:chemosensory pili system protein ChpA (sensor histidine kinase/response regulator)
MSNLTTQNYDGQLIQIVEQSNIEPTKGAQMMQLFVPYFKRMDEVERKISILPAENPSKEDCEMAKAIRKALRDNRLEAERIKKQGKEAIIVEGRLFDNLYNIIDNSSKPLEKRCEAIEKWHEIEEAKRVEAVYLERKNLCDELGADTVFVNIRQMSDDQFTAYIDQIKAAQAAKAEADRIEADRLAAEERKLDDRMKSRLKTLAAMDIDGGLMNIREMPDEQFDTFVKSEQAKIAARAAAAKAAEEARIEAAKVADEQRIAREAAEKEAEKARAEAAEAKKAAEKLAEDARAATAAAAEAERLKAESDRAALLAPDRDKLAFLITQIAGINIPQLETFEAEKITRNVKTLLGKVRAYIEQEADKL